MNAFLLANGNLVVPKRAESDGVIGDAMTVIGPAHPDYPKWRDFVQPATPEIEKAFGNQEPEQ